MIERNPKLQKMLDNMATKIAGGKATLTQCKICLIEIGNQCFRDNESYIEYRISGLCQACQDKVFEND